MYRFVVLFCLGYPLPLCAGQIERGTVHERNGVYELHVSAVIDAGSEAVFRLISDHEGLRRLSRVIVESTLLVPTVPGVTRRRLRLNVCILLFCFKGPLVEDVATHGRERITTVVVSAQSAFRSGSGDWRLAAVDERRSRIQLDYLLEPDFWIPPVIGPWLIKRRMLGVAREAIGNIETLAGAD
ncbi:MAG: SRPBCC family protein [Gammaproteobacteria bacterium]|nr:SRPBCC family protein [Gammaproteobacteria bacterium]